MSTLTRRDFCALVGASLIVGSSCRRLRESFSPYEGRLTARPNTSDASNVVARPGRINLGLDQDRDAILQVPNATQARFPLLVMLHGATQNADDMFWYLGNAPEETGVVILAPNSRDTTWDAI